ncbi:MAG: T9SS type A sorting domain-containing protein [Chitinophagales bacterium]|nr:T9SS type A sorting domain-containing protein [Chitinophagales bacterium]
MTINNFSESDTGVYRLVVTGIAPCTMDSVEARIDLTPRAKLNASLLSPTSRTVCFGDSIRWTAGGEDIMNYTWSLNGNVLPQTDSFLNIPSAQYGQAGTYRVIANAFNGCVKDTIDGLTLTVNEPISFTSNLAKVDSICVGQSYTMSVTPTGTNTGFTYQWYKDGSLVGTTSTNDLTGATSAMNGKYHAVVTATGSACPSRNTDTLAFVVNSQPSVVGLPIDPRVCLGGTTSFTVTPSNTAGISWFKDNVSQNNTTNTLAIGGATYTQRGVYEVRAKALKGCTDITSGVSTMLYVDTPISISTNILKTDSICINQSYTWSLVPRGTAPNGYSYVWYKDNAQVGTDTTHRVTNALLSASGRYFAMVQGSGSACPSFTSDTMNFVVNSLPLQPTIVSTSVVCEGVPVTMTATGAQNHTGFAWYKSGNSTPLKTAGVNDVTYSFGSTLTSPGSYRVVALGLKGCANAESALFSLGVTARPVVQTQPVGREYEFGENMTLTSTGVNASRVQWYRNGQPLPNETRNTLTRSSYQYSDSGFYQLYYFPNSPCVDTVKSAVAHVQSILCPRITTQPIAQIEVCEGQPFSMNILGTGARSYIWRKTNGQVMQNGVNENYSVTSAMASDNGIYEVELVPFPGLTCPTTVSNKVMVGVYERPEIYQDLEGPKSCEVSNHRLRVDANYSAGFRWYKNGQPIPNVTTNEYLVSNATVTGDVYRVEVLGSSTCPSVWSDSLRIVNRDPSVRVTLAMNTQMNLVEQCEDASGYTYYAPAGSPNAFMMAIHKNGNNVSFAPDIYVNGSERLVAPSVADFNHGYIFGRRTFNVDVTQGTIVNPYKVRFFYSDVERNTMKTLYESISRTASQSGRSTTLVHGDNSWIVSTSQAFNNTLLNTIQAPLNFANAISLNNGGGAQNGVPYVEIDNLFAEQGGGTSFYKYQLRNSSGIQDAGSFEASLWPNPTTDGMLTVKVNADNFKPVSFSVYDMSGRLLMQTDEAHSNFETDYKFDLSSLSNGNYQIVVTNEANKKALKFTVLK